MKVTRRGVLLGVLAASGATLAYQRFPWEAALRTPMEDFVLELLRVVAVPEPVALGQARLREDPSLKREADRLFDSVFGDLPVATAGTARELAEALAEKARRQFETGDVVRASGWILARVERDLCTLVALDHRPG